MVDVLIVGGGLAGLISSIVLSRSGLEVMLIERKKYPFHKVCGEYVSNETLPFLEKHDLFPSDLSPARLETLLISSTKGNSFSTSLDLGGFGVSRYEYDHWLADKARTSGVKVIEETAVTDIQFQSEHFAVSTNKGTDLKARIVIGAHGKRSKIDQNLNRPFLEGRYPYVGVKYHVKGDLDQNTVALHNFVGGYCGVSSIEADKFNICYLTHRDQLKQHGSIEELEKNVLMRNPLLKSIFLNSEFLLDKPEVINEISFEKKEAVYNHVLMTGDSAGMITPLCGNGMAMAIHSAKLLAECIIEHWKEGRFIREELEQMYEQKWDGLFARRLWVGRQIQHSLFGNALASGLAVTTGKYFKQITRSLIKMTHGAPFE